MTHGIISLLQLLWKHCHLLIIFYNHALSILNIFSQIVQPDISFMCIVCAFEEKTVLLMLIIFININILTQGCKADEYFESKTVIPVII